MSHPGEHEGSGVVRAARIRLLLIVVPLLIGVAVEIAAFWWLADLIGGFWAFLAVVAGTVAGAVLAGREGRRSFSAAVELVRGGQDPGPALVGGVLGVVGAVLMILPGLVNTVVGLIVVLGRPLLVRPVSALLKRRARRHGLSTGSGRQSPGRSTHADGSHDVVRGEVIDTDAPTDSSEDSPGDPPPPGVR